MIRNIAGTILTRFINALISFAAMIIISRNFGAEGIGTIGLIVLGITIIVLINNFVGGSALVYLVPRYDLYRLIIPSYIWALFSAVPVSFLLSLAKLIPVEYTYHVLLLSLMFSITSINQMVLLGREKINLYNLISMSQMIVMISCLVIFTYNFPEEGIIIYIYSLYCAYFISLVWSTLAIRKLLTFSSLDGISDILREIFRLGAILQAANLFQLLNYRLSYYLVDFFSGRGALGVFNLGVQLSEGVWNIPKSLSTVIYSRISNSDDSSYVIKLTLGFFKLSLIITILILSIIILIPEYIFGLIFGAEFTEVKTVILFLAAGIAAISASMILSNYFSGTGRPHHNTISSGIGLVFTLLMSLWLIPIYGLAGAGIAATISYSASCLYQIIMFRKISGAKTRDFIINADDFKIVKEEISKILHISK
jgi:O-antigen/teichoic acid export membrane protein